MPHKNHIMFYLSALLAVTGAVSYQYFVKLVPSSLNPIVSVMALYIGALTLTIVLLPFFPAEGGFLAHVRQLSWVQLMLAVSVVLIELGFLLMYRYGWPLGTGNLVTGVLINLVLVGLGVSLLGESVSLVNAIGIALCIAGVALISYRP